jgi:hypothetical protein
MITTFLRRKRRQIADRRTPPPVPAAADPWGTRVCSELDGLGAAGRPHGGSDDLTVWPASMAEEVHATHWLATGDPAARDDLYAATGSEDRAFAIVLAVREQRDREAAARKLLDRALGIAPTGGDQ